MYPNNYDDEPVKIKTEFIGDIELKYWPDGSVSMKQGTISPDIVKVKAQDMKKFLDKLTDHVYGSTSAPNISLPGYHYVNVKP